MKPYCKGLPKVLRGTTDANKEPLFLRIRRRRKKKIFGF